MRSEAQHGSDVCCVNVRLSQERDWSTHMELNVGMT